MFVRKVSQDHGVKKFSFLFQLFHYPGWYLRISLKLQGKCDMEAPMILLAPRIKQYSRMFPSKEKKKYNNFKNAKSPNDLLAFMGREGSIQIKPVF